MKFSSKRSTRSNFRKRRNKLRSHSRSKRTSLNKLKVKHSKHKKVRKAKIKCIFQKQKKFNNLTYDVKILFDKKTYWIAAECKKKNSLKIIEMEKAQGKELFRAYNNNFNTVIDMLSIKKE